MPYCGTNLGLKNGKCQPGTIGGIREVLDACHARNIKVVFPLNYQLPWLENYPGATNMRFKDVEYSRDWRAWDEAVTTEIVAKAVETLRDHPALLAWYVADEVAPSKSPFLRQRRALINRLDPWHPTWAVYCVEQDLPYHVGTADLIGMDPYPICSNITDTKTIELTSRWMQAVRRVASTDQGVLTWCVPQFFSWGYKDSMTDRDKYLSRYRDPSEVEMRAQCLLMAIHGCRGIIAYNYHHFIGPTIPAAAPDFPRRWAEMCRVGELMKELAPYLLSTREEDVPVAAESGVVRARLFRGEAGGARVLVVGEGPGKARARLTLPPGAVSKSLYGATKPAEDGTWVFEGTDVCCDVLE